VNVKDQKQAQALAIRLWLGCLATQEMLCNYLGIQLGLYEALAEGGAATADQLAERARIAPRYAREWLEQQAVSGIVKVERASVDAAQRVFSLPEEHREVLSHSDSPLSRIAGILPLGAVAHALPQLLDAYRSGEGLADKAYGLDWRWGHGSSNRALYAHSLAGWIRTALPDIHSRLSAPDARAADIACGAGWAAIALARAYPNLHVDGFEIDADLGGDATLHAEQSGVAERVRFHIHDCSQPGIGGRYDLVCLFDTLHEMPKPVQVLGVCGTVCAATGCVLVMDARVADEFTAPANEIERFQYTTSVLHCLPACLAERPSAGTGTVMRPALVRQYAKEAGFSGMEILRLEERFHRFYRLLR
jgi:2-polyprenyl-3-methyl-5-hydroxy-6-metoxy-1,4-benzoquinol methylase